MVELKMESISLYGLWNFYQQQKATFHMVLILASVAPFHSAGPQKSLPYCKDTSYIRPLINMHTTFDPYDFEEDA